MAETLKITGRLALRTSLGAQHSLHNAGDGREGPNNTMIHSHFARRSYNFQRLTSDYNKNNAIKLHYRTIRRKSLRERTSESHTSDMTPYGNFYKHRTIPHTSKHDTVVVGHLNQDGKSALTRENRKTMRVKLWEKTRRCHCSKHSSRH
ncbi:hypothetical protein HW555_000855 [Spodoptera exigua]|uniref:Uncharacterized protein n=1 Tax=Spodoptera exigua TaxID=7107 RepID=A0A835GTC0_SPOEX|nr:hypothetical protein HW555_000855 [Spodoptera exigua]